VNRAEWTMHLKPPKVPPAATAAFEASIGPRVLPGTYTVKMTKGDKVYTTKLNVVLDPRAKFTVDDRKQQYDLVLKLGAMLNHMSWAVDSIVGVRDGARARAAKLKAQDPLRQKLASLADQADAIRGKIVATKEGGMITGEERLREWSTQLYGAVNQYEGRPTAEQVSRADVLSRELEDVIKEFNTLTSSQLTALNQQLRSKKLEPITVISEQDWKAADEKEGAAPSGTTMRGRRDADLD